MKHMEGKWFTSAFVAGLQLLSNDLWSELFHVLPCLSLLLPFRVVSASACLFTVELFGGGSGDDVLMR